MDTDSVKKINIIRKRNIANERLWGSFDRWINVFRNWTIQWDKSEARILFSSILMVLLLDKTNTSWQDPHSTSNLNKYLRPHTFILLPFSPYNCPGKLLNIDNKQNIFLSFFCVVVKYMSWYPVAGLNKSRHAINFITLTSELTIL